MIIVIVFIIPLNPIELRVLCDRRRKWNERVGNQQEEALALRNVCHPVQFYGRYENGNLIQAPILWKIELHCDILAR